MRVVAYVLTVLLVTAVMVGETVLLLLTSTHREPGTTGIAGAGLGVMVYGPLMLGSVAAWWRMRDASDAGRYYRLWLIWTAVASAVGAALVVVGGVLSGTAPWAVAIVIATGVVLLAVAVPLGDRVRRSADRHREPSAEHWTPTGPGAVVRVVRITAITFAAVLLVGVVGAAVLAATVDPDLFGDTVLLAVPLAFFGAGLACALAGLRVSKNLREAAAGDIGTLRKLMRVVLRGKPESLDDTEQVAAARYAAGIPIALGIQLAFLGLLYAGLVIQQVITLLGSDGGSPMQLAILVLLVLMLAVVVPLTVVRIRRARRYAREHADLLQPETV
ncbi:hypothetical protein CLV46_2379 [Diaminobutyricimonas aerilata]|uniref:Uncharacterized protein n=1 Tax=Diaminobutyricimonas aerilata TaxID=1162967 RepID=A0A2M9CLL6_9MICO|nr:hypothetical protein [Diaminobutyricimonas aerilata]PJJ72802.1 hypothetical protein CLV46_2379 [Diaminobutyricimonas aerilata]